MTSKLAYLSNDCLVFVDILKEAIQIITSSEERSKSGEQW